MITCAADISTHSVGRQTRTYTMGEEGRVVVREGGGEVCGGGGGE